MTNLAPQPIFQGLGPNGTALAGGSLYTYAAGTTTPQATYTDSTGSTPNTNPVILNSFGQAAVWLDPTLAYKFILRDGLGNQIWSADNIQAALSGTGSIIPSANNLYDVGSATYEWRNGYFGNGYFGTQVYIGTTPVLNGGNVGYWALTPAEIAASVTPVNYSESSVPINVLRYGVVPNSPSDAVANTVILKALLNPSTPGPTGRLIFPNTTGADVYYLAGVIPIRDGIHIDLMGCTINNTYTAAASDVNTGLFYALRDFSCENGEIVSNVVTSAATGSGACIYIGARGIGHYFTVFDASLATPMGNISLRNLRLSSTNTGTWGPTSNAIVLLGGLVNVLCENIVINGNGMIAGGIYYEFGWATSPGGTAASQSSHAHNMTFRNIKVYDMLTAGVTDGYGIGLTGCYNCTVDGLYVNGAYNGFEYRLGEALFYNPWANVDDVGSKHTITLRNIVCEAITSTGISLIGAESASGGYLSGAGLTASQQTDLMTFSIDGFAVGNGAGTGMFVSGAIVAKNGYLANTAGSGELIISDDCMQFEFENVRIVGSSAQGVRANFPGIGVWATPRQKIGKFSNCIVAGNGTYGFEFGANTRSVKIINCRIGYSSLYDNAAESIQGIGVLCDPGCNGVVCDSNFITTAASANAYSITGTTSAGCGIINPLGTQTSAGAWELDGVALSTSTNLGTAANIINAAPYKHYGKKCLNTSTNTLFIAQGSLTTSAWISVDGVTTITPV
jgi:hypothetical protein